MKAPPSVGLFTPSCAALIPVARATLPPSRIATRMPLPAASVAAPKVAKMPMPTIIPAVKSVAVNGPSSRLRPPPRALLTTGRPARRKDRRARRREFHWDLQGEVTQLRVDQAKAGLAGHPVEEDKASSLEDELPSAGDPEVEDRAWSDQEPVRIRLQEAEWTEFELQVPFPRNRGVRRIERPVGERGARQRDGDARKDNDRRGTVHRIPVGRATLPLSRNAARMPRGDERPELPPETALSRLLATAFSRVARRPFLIRYLSSA